MKNIILGAVLGLVIWGVAAPTAYSKLLDRPQQDAVPPALDPSGGGYAVVHEDGHVCGIIAGNSYFANNDKVMGSEYMGCPAGSKIIFQMKLSSDGNAYGVRGSDVTYSNGIFTWGSTTIKDGIATDADGRVWDTGSNAVIATEAVPRTPMPPIVFPSQPTTEPSLPLATPATGVEPTFMPQPTAEPTQSPAQPTPAPTQFTQAPTSTPLVVAVAITAPTQSPAVVVVTVVNTSSISIPLVSVTQKTQKEEKEEWEPNRRRWGGEHYPV